MKRFLSLYKNVVLKHHSDNHMREGAGDYRSIGQVSGEWWSVFHFRSLAIFKIRRKKNCPSAIVQNRFDICLKAHFILLLLVSREKCVQKKVFELITRWSQNYYCTDYWVKKSLLIVYQLSDSHSVTKGSARSMTTNTTSWDRAGTAKLAKAVGVFYRYARGWIFFTKWKYDGESTSTVLPIRIWRWQEGGGKMSTARVGFE